MTIAEPSPEVLAEADHGKLRELADRAYDLWTTHKGEIPGAEWQALWAEAVAAAGGHVEFLESVWRFGPK